MSYININHFEENEGQKPLKFSCGLNEDKIFYVGSEHDSDIKVSDPDGEQKIHCAIIHRRNVGWFLAQCPEGGKQTSWSGDGVFIYIKNYEELLAKNEKKVSKAQKLYRGMKIFFSFNVFEVTEI